MIQPGEVPFRTAQLRPLREHGGGTVRDRARTGGHPARRVADPGSRASGSGQLLGGERKRLCGIGNHRDGDGSGGHGHRRALEPIGEAGAGSEYTVSERLPCNVLIQGNAFGGNPVRVPCRRKCGGQQQRCAELDRGHHHRHPAVVEQCEALGEGRSTSWSLPRSPRSTATPGPIRTPSRSRSPSTCRPTREVASPPRSRCSGCTATSR